MRVKKDWTLWETEEFNFNPLALMGAGVEDMKYVDLLSETNEVLADKMKYHLNSPELLKIFYESLDETEAQSWRGMLARRGMLSIIHLGIS